MRVEQIQLLEELDLLIGRVLLQQNGGVVVPRAELEEALRKIQIVLPERR